MEEGQRQGAERHQPVRHVAGVHAGAIFGEGDSADVVQAVLTTPVIVHEPSQKVRAFLRRGKIVRSEITSCLVPYEASRTEWMATMDRVMWAISRQGDRRSRKAITSLISSLVSSEERCSRQPRCQSTIWAVWTRV